MVRLNSFEIMKRFTTAARQLIEGDMANAAEGRFSKTIFMAAVGRGAFAEQCGIDTAMAQGVGVIGLEFGAGSKLDGPRCFTVAMRDRDGVPRVFRDCAIVADGGERLILVPTGAGANGHFRIGAAGLEHHEGQPAALRAAMRRASGRLLEVAKTVTRSSSTLSVHLTRDAA